MTRSGRWGARLRVVAKWVIPVGLVLEVGLLVLAKVAPGHMVVLGLIVETVLTVALIGLVPYGRASYRRARSEGLDPSGAFRRVLDELLPGLAARALWHEIVLIGSVVAVVRRRPDVEPGATAFGYGRDQLWPIVAVCSPVFANFYLYHHMVRWGWLRIVGPIIDVYVILLVMRMYCSMRSHPHVLSAERVVLRAAHVATLAVPLDVVERAVKTMHSVNTRSIRVVDDVVSVATPGSTNVELVLKPGTRLLVDGEHVSARSARFDCEDPTRAVQTINDALDARAATALPAVDHLVGD